MKKKEQGAAILIITAILILATLLIMVFLSSHIVSMQKTAGNQYFSNQAFDAADAGLEYGITYLITNRATIVASASSGSINHSLATTTLANNSTFLVTYTNPTANNYQLITITSVGKNADGTSTHTVQQMVYQGTNSLYTVDTQGNVTVNGHGGSVSGNAAIDAGGSVAASASSGGTVVQNDANLSGMSATQFFTNYFGTSPATFESESTVYASSASVPWGSSLSGNIWIDSAVSIAGNVIAGSAAAPVLMVVNGDYAVSASGNATINGVLYVMGTTTFAGNATVNGALISQGPVNFRGNGVVNYNPNMITLSLGSVNPNYAKVSGSWRDF